MPGYDTDLSQFYIITNDVIGKTITFGKFTSKFNGIRLVFSNGTTSNLANTTTFAVTSNDTIVTGSGAGNIPALLVGESVEYIGKWNQSLNQMAFYKIR